MPAPAVRARKIVTLGACHWFLIIPPTRDETVPQAAVNSKGALGRAPSRWISRVSGRSGAMAVSQGVCRLRGADRSRPTTPRPGRTAIGRRCPATTPAPPPPTPARTCQPIRSRHGDTDPVNGSRNPRGTPSGPTHPATADRSRIADTITVLTHGRHDRDKRLNSPPLRSGDSEARRSTFCPGLDCARLACESTGGNMHKSSISLLGDREETHAPAA